MLGVAIEQTVAHAAAGGDSSAAAQPPMRRVLRRCAECYADAQSATPEPTPSAFLAASQLSYERRAGSCPPLAPAIRRAAAGDHFRSVHRRGGASTGASPGRAHIRSLGFRL